MDPGLGSGGVLVPKRASTGVPRVIEPFVAAGLRVGRGGVAAGFGLELYCVGDSRSGCARNV